MSNVAKTPWGSDPDTTESGRIRRVNLLRAAAEKVESNDLRSDEDIAEFLKGIVGSKITIRRLEPSSDDRVYSTGLEDLEKIIAQQTSGIKGAIPEQADRELASDFLKQIANRFNSSFEIGTKVRIKNTLFCNDRVGTLRPNSGELDDIWAFNVLLDKTDTMPSRTIGVTVDQIEAI